MTKQRVAPAGTAMNSSYGKMSKPRVQGVDKRYSVYLPETPGLVQPDLVHKTVFEKNPLKSAFLYTNNHAKMAYEAMTMTDDRVLSPSTTFMTHWDSFMTGLICFTAIVTPYEISFMEPSFDYLFVFNRMVDFAFFIDIGFNFFLSYFDNAAGHWVKNQRIIAMNYLKGWFITDFLSIIPIDVLMLTVDETDANLQDLRIIRFTRVVRFVKLLRLLRSARIFARLQKNFGLSFATTSLYKFVAIVIVIIHWMACVWNLSEKLAGDLINWKSDQIYIDEQSSFETYCASVEVSIMFMVMSYGRFVPRNSFESVIAILCMLIAGSVYAYVIGSICSVVSMRDPATQEFQQTMDLLNAYMKEVHLPLHLQDQLRTYFIHCKQLFRTRYYCTLWEGMSPILRGQVANFLHYNWIAQISFFNAPSPDERYRFTTAVAMNLEPDAFVPDEPILIAGDAATSMYIVQKGLAAGGHRIYSKGSFFGSEMICLALRRQFDVRALTYIDVMILEMSKLYEILNEGQFQATKKLIRKAAIRISFQTKMRQIVGMSRMTNNNYRKMSAEEIQQYKKDLIQKGRSATLRTKMQRAVRSISAKPVEVQVEVNKEDAELIRNRDLLGFWTGKNENGKDIALEEDKELAINERLSSLEKSIENLSNLMTKHFVEEMNTNEERKVESEPKDVSEPKRETPGRIVLAPLTSAPAQAKLL